MVWQTDVHKYQTPEYFKPPLFFITGLETEWAFCAVQLYHMKENIYTKQILCI